MGTLERGLSRTASRTGPLGLEEASALFAPLREASRLVVAVSGGPDSVALMSLAALVAREGPMPPMAVATVDHALQAASHEVAAGVMAQAQDLGLEAHLLTWTGPKPSTGLQEAARRERYRLLGGLAERLGATHLLTAHTLDDQAETILFRLARGSGPAGLVGMRRVLARDGVVHHRPFLDLPKRRLIETCQARGWRFVQDPANGDPRFTRARLRQLLPALAREGLDAETFAHLGRRLARDQEALESVAAALLESISLSGDIRRKRLKAAALLCEPAAIVLRVLETVLTDFAKPGAPRLGRLEDLADDLRCAHATGRPLRRTLHGHIVGLTASGTIDIVPEDRRRRGRPAADAGG